MDVKYCPLFPPDKPPLGEDWYRYGVPLPLQRKLATRWSTVRTVGSLFKMLQTLYKVQQKLVENADIDMTTDGWQRDEVQAIYEKWKATRTNEIRSGDLYSDVPTDGPQESDLWRTVYRTLLKEAEVELAAQTATCDHVQEGGKIITKNKLAKSRHGDNFTACRVMQEKIRLRVERLQQALDRIQQRPVAETDEVTEMVELVMDQFRQTFPDLLQKLSVIPPKAHISCPLRLPAVRELVTTQIHTRDVQKANLYSGIKSEIVQQVIGTIKTNLTAEQQKLTQLIQQDQTKKSKLTPTAFQSPWIYTKTNDPETQGDIDHLTDKSKLLEKNLLSMGLTQDSDGPTAEALKAMRAQIEKLYADQRQGSVQSNRADELALEEATLANATLAKEKATLANATLAKEKATQVLEERIQTNERSREEITTLIKDIDANVQTHERDISLQSKSLGTDLDQKCNGGEGDQPCKLGWRGNQQCRDREGCNVETKCEQIENTTICDRGLDTVGEQLCMAYDCNIDTDCLHKYCGDSGYCLHIQGQPNVCMRKDKKELEEAALQEECNEQVCTNDADCKVSCGGRGRCRTDRCVRDSVI
jgi:hypothetical protein